MSSKMKFDFPMVGEDGNAFSLMGRWEQLALRAGWTKDETTDVLDDAMSNDYDHLLSVLMRHSENNDQEEL